MPLSRANILSKLKGSSFMVEGLRSTFDGWPSATNPALDRIRNEVDQWLVREFPRHPKLRQLRKGDYGLFGATWWPRASFERLRTATLFAIWLFLWDDEIDSDVGSLSQDSTGAQEFRWSTLDYISYTLGLQDQPSYSDSCNNIIRSFETIGKALRAAWSLEDRRSFLLECEFFMEKSEVEQRMRLAGHFPSEDEFWRYRLGTSAVPLVLMLNAYCNDIDHLPLSIQADPAYGALLDLTNVNICAVNDLLSMKKEVAQGAIDNLVAIFFVSTGDIQTASDRVMEVVRDSAQQIEETMVYLIEKHGSTTEKEDLIRNLVEGCAFYATGNLEWSLRTGRYGIHADEGDCFQVQLQ